MALYTVHDVTGTIVARVSVEGDASAYLSEITPLGGGYVVGDYDDVTYYISGGIGVEKPTTASSIDKETIQADGFDAATITGIPAGWNYEISNGVSGVTDGTDVVLTALEPGVFTIKFTNWPYQDIEYTINASATPL